MFGYFELRLPTIVVERLHRHFLPICAGWRAILEHGAKHIMTIGVDVRSHLHPLADYPLDGKTSALDFRQHILDDDPPQQWKGRHVLRVSLHEES